MKNDFIILVGSDGAGKSTIAEGLSNVLDYPVEHHGPVKNYEEGKKEYFDCVENTNYSVIKDRFYEGEKIYAPIYRNYNGSDYFAELEEKLKEKFNVLLVLVEPPFEIVEQRLLERGEDFIKREDWHYAYCAMRDFFYDSSLPKVRISTYEHTLEDNVNYIISKI